MAEQYSVEFLIKAIDEAGKPLQKISADFQALKNQVSETYSVMEKGKRTSPLSKVGQDVGGMVSQFGKLGGMLGLAGGAFAFNSIIQGAMSFDQAMAKIATRIPGDRKKLSELGLGMKEVSEKTGIGVDVLAVSMLDLVNNYKEAGSPELLERLRTSMKLSKLAFSDIAVSTEYLSHVTKAYGTESLKDMEQAASMTFDTLKKADVSLEEFSGTIVGMAPNAKELGISMSEMFSVFSTFSEGKQQFGQVASGMQFLLRSMMKAGPQFHDFSKGAMDPLTQAIANLGFASGKDLIGKRGFAGAMEGLRQQAISMGIPLENLIGGGKGMFLAMRIGSKGVKELKENMKGLPNQMKEMNKALAAYDEVNKSGKAWRQFQAIMKSISLEVGGLILPHLTESVGNFLPILKTFSSLLKEGGLSQFLEKISKMSSGEIFDEVSKGAKSYAGAVASPFTLLPKMALDKAAPILSNDNMKQFLNAAYMNPTRIGEKEKNIYGLEAQEQVLRIVFPTDDEGNPLINVKKDTGPMKVKTSNGPTAKTVGG